MDKPKFPGKEFVNISVTVIGDGKQLVSLNSSWKPEIGLWLQNCGEAPSIFVLEQFENKICESRCLGRGVCNHDVGRCRCFHGFEGDFCELERNFVCFDAHSESKHWLEAFGSWRVSVCGASCDSSRSFCYCGERAKYPERPVAESCGFAWATQETGRIDWNMLDASIYANDGWCNRDIHNLSWHQDYTKCACKYDGRDGLLCQIPVESFCINQCSGNGVCQGGSCACVEGWYGIDCSIPSSLSSVKSWPDWLLPGFIKVTESSKTWPQQSLQMVVERQRPLIYIYELPPRFNSLLLEGRHWKFHCALRLYDGNNATVWIDNLYGSEIAVLEMLLSSGHRTMNADEADFFYVPVLGACAIERADEAPHMKLEGKQGEKLSRPYFSGELYKEAYEYVKDSFPFWNQSEGRDHIWLFPWDEGACAAPKEIWNSMMLVHWGNSNSKHKTSTTAYGDDNWDGIPEEWRGIHPCYDPKKDLVIPAWKLPGPTLRSTSEWARTREERHTLFYFNGNLGEDYWGRPEPKYSMGLRQKLARLFSSEASKTSAGGEQRSSDLIVTYKSSPAYEDELSRSRFCGVLPGDGWSGRMEDSVLHGCIPVIIQDGIHLPFENVLNYDDFAVRVREDELPNLLSILRNMNESRIDSMLTAVSSVRQRFSYIGAYILEASREKRKRTNQASWIDQAATSFEKNPIDAFSTFVEVLRYKLGTRTWTKTAAAAAADNNTVKDYCEEKPLI